MTLSLYGQYLKERTSTGIIETEEGFATFEYVNESIVYIKDLYIIPEKRKEGVATRLADKIVEEAVQAGRTQLLGSVDVTAKGAETSIKVLEAYGMKATKVAEPMIFYVKEIGV
jgi:GNAT superfamily N-acetyltransferase